jgi:hypothetical protein
VNLEGGEAPSFLEHTVRSVCSIAAPAPPKHSRNDAEAEAAITTHAEDTGQWTSASA